MRTVLIFSVLLVIGLTLSQFVPAQLGPGEHAFRELVRLLTMIALAFIMIHVGFEFHIDKSRLHDYGWDYVVAMSAAALPWIFVAAYFIFVMLPSTQWGSFDAWKESLLAGRYAAPTSAGVLFAMLAAAGMSRTWMFGKARVLAIFDDLDTVLLMIPLKMMMVGVAWQLIVVTLLLVGMLSAGWRWMRQWQLPSSWPWVVLYSVVIAAFSAAIHYGSKALNENVPIDVEVLLPAFLLGVAVRNPRVIKRHGHAERQKRELLENRRERRVAGLVSGAFMLLVGLNMPSVFSGAHGAAAETAAANHRVLSDVPQSSYWVLALHVLALTVLSNVGKMFPAFCYRREATPRERLALAVGMWPRGEVGAGVLVVSLGYGITGPVVTAAMLSLALNLLLTGVFILLVKRLLGGLEHRHPPDPRH